MKRTEESTTADHVAGTKKITGKDWLPLRIFSTEIQHEMAVVAPCKHVQKKAEQSEMISFSAGSSVSSSVLHAHSITVTTFIK